MTQWLTKKSTLWTLFALSLLLFAGFGLVMRTYSFSLIDELSDPGAVRALIASFNDAQRSAHIWTTATLDVAFPIAYGLLFAGLALKAFGRAGPFLALPGFGVIPVDLAEGIVQVLGLSANAAILDHKAWLTPLKLGLFCLGLLFAIIAGLVLIARTRKRVPSA